MEGIPWLSLLMGGLLGTAISLQVAFMVAFERWMKHSNAYLKESALRHSEFAEAIELYRYGAHDEAIEVLSRWKSRQEKT